jgi:hypothetical protein
MLSFEFGSWRVHNGNMVYIYICYVVARRFYLMSVLYMPCNVTDFFDMYGVARMLKAEVSILLGTWFSPRVCA